MNDQTVYRKPHDADHPYVVISKTVFEDTALSWKAKGIMGYLLTRPDDWIVRHGDLVKRSPEGASAVRSAVRELEQNGYLTRERTKDEHGRYNGIEVLVHEHPVTLEQRTYRPPRPHADEPRNENPHTESPQVDNHTLLSTDVLLSTESTKNPAADGDSLADDFKTPAPRQHHSVEAFKARHAADPVGLMQETAGARATLEAQGKSADYTDASKDNDGWNGIVVPAWCRIADKSYSKMTAPTRFKLAGIFHQVGVITDSSPAQVARAIEDFPKAHQWWTENVGYEWPTDKFLEYLSGMLIPDAEPAPLEVGW